jgi:putative transposase
VPRRAPIDPHGIYHVGSRGNFGEPLFRTPGEHELFLELYERYSAKFGLRTLAWCLLWNHHHFLVQLTDGGLSEAMQLIHHGFSRRMNAVYGRTGKGHLVRHSFFAELVQTDAYFRQVNRYIDLNPVEAGRCIAPEDWPWSGCAATLGLAKPRTFHDVRAQLGQFGASPLRAQTKYRRLLASPFPGEGVETGTSAA